MTDGTSWLAAPQSVAFGGYSVFLARGLSPEELVTRIAPDACGGKRTVRPLGPLTGADLVEYLEDEYGDAFDGLAVRHGNHDGWAFAVLYGGWQGESADLLEASLGAHIFHLEYEEENGKPVPPQFYHLGDGEFRCGFNLHLDGSWGYTGVNGDPGLAARVTALLTAAGLPDENVPRPEVHRRCLEVLDSAFGLSLPRTAIQDGVLAASVLATD
ncbi:hypothetical protein ABT095_07160 [Kitasatospora sp. NPDC002227]|uniref:DUF6461 domain-containing protein n=1 Tax=Kitasatospora sp. NPDC002227 TaxID=3154773 RepID=UPI003321E967